jgi:hypothetical protein
MAKSRRRAWPSKAELQALTRRALPFEGEPALRILHAPIRSADRTAIRSLLAPIDPAMPVEGPDRRENLATSGEADAGPVGKARAPTCTPTCAPPDGIAVAIGIRWIAVTPAVQPQPYQGVVAANAVPTTAPAASPSPNPPHPQPPRQPPQPPRQPPPHQAASAGAVINGTVAAINPAARATVRNLMESLLQIY